MEISLTHILLAAIGMGVLVIIVQAIIFNKLKLLQAQASQQASDTNQQHSGAMQARVQDLFQAGVEEIKAAQLDCQHKNQQSLKAVNQLITAKIQDAQTENTKMHSQLQTQLQQLQQDVSTQSSEQHRQTSSNIIAAIASTRGLIEASISNTGSQLNTAIQDAQAELEKDANQLMFTHKQQQLSNLETLSGLIQNLRVQNLVELTNELAQHTELQVDTLDFVKHLGECKVVKIEDKHTGQVTQVYYENGIKHSSDTLQGEQLKYQMFYDHEGKLVKGIEYGDDQRVIFEYLYDAAGEISQRLEYGYDANGKQADPIKKVY
ncbi:Methyl-accepting chemotaxis protein [Shewanella benthica]|uniref:Methyl-accepting chemotaxis protein n=1 Tax=Shewanella benthica TaxID=43661 RepID=A0A330LW23_9GAMM|nr:hypothetical protein [Shewanella benthica]SQH74111.1 Methyl-accepting chemotaxis protein [Shewanella benthica]